MRRIVKEKVQICEDGSRYYTYEETLVSDNEYYTRKYNDTYPKTNLKKIFDSYRDYKETKEWD